MFRIFSDNVFVGFVFNGFVPAHKEIRISEPSLVALALVVDLGTARLPNILAMYSQQKLQLGQLIFPERVRLQCYYRV